MSDQELSPIKRALIEQRRLRARIQELEKALEQPVAEPIAVIGMSCRLPGARNLAEFWTMLEHGVDAISEMPASRWDVAARYDADPETPGKIATHLGGYIDNIDQLDAQRFGITPREAASMDPQQRVLLEVTWEALEHAGLAPDSLTGAQMGVFIGIGPTDYLNRVVELSPLDEIDAYLTMGNANSIATGRIAYLLGTHGPAVAVDTACSSSLTAIELACESLRARSSDTVVAGGVGILLADQNYISMSKARMMAPDGRCKTFDARADGFVRSEGCGVVILKRLRDAQRDGDRVLAVIRGGAVNQDGRSNGITAPNGPAQQALIRRAHTNSGTSPLSVSYVEAHGTGTALGDPIEVDALAATLGANRDASQPLHIGSVKSNIGHAEAAAGVAGLIKTVLALQHGVIPPSLHFETPNPHIDWAAYPYLRVPTKLTPWTSPNGPRTAGVSAFGFSGTNVHLVVEEAPVANAAPSGVERPVHVVALSGKNVDALKQAARDLAAAVRNSKASLADLAYSVNTGRATLAHRAAMVVSSVAELEARLDAVASDAVDARVQIGAVAEGMTPRVLYDFSNNSSENAAQAKALYASQPVFRGALDRCDEILKAAGVASLLGANGAPLETVDDAGRVAIDFSLATMWAEWGVRADAVLAGRRGELSALVAAGVLRIEDALVAVSRKALPEGVVRATPTIPMFSTSIGRRLSAPEIAALAPWLAPSDASRANEARSAAASEGYRATIDMSVLEWNGLASALAERFAQGATVDWRGFDRGYPRARVDVPSSPWLRDRFWFDDNWSSRPTTSATVVDPTWTLATRAATRQSALVPADVELSRYVQTWAELDAFTTNAIAKAFLDLGLFRHAGERHTVDSAMRAGNVQPVYRHLLSLWLQRLVRDGRLVQSDDAYAAPATHELRATPSGIFGPASDAFPLLQAYLRRCEHGIAAIVTGRQSALDTLFPDGSLETADFFYRHWGVARYYNAILEATSEAIIQQANGRPLRVLEIGAGTGGTASTLAPLFGNAGAEYWFTDVSEYFFGRAEEAFAAVPSMRFVRFDVDSSPRDQGVPLGQFDLVVASNAVHAAKNLGRAIEHARSLLAPNGMLMLYEATTHLDWFEMSIALIEGWQHHIDDLRAETPLLAPAQWEQALTERGFDRVAYYPAVNSPTGVLAHHIILASVPATAVVETTKIAPATQTVGRTANGNGASSPIAQPHTSTERVAETAAIAPPSAVASAASTTAAPASPATSSVRDVLSPLTHGERVEWMRELVQRHVKKVMRLRADAPPPGTNDRLMSAGMDSLMAVDLRKLLTKELGGAVVLPSTLIFDHPTIGAIVTLILDTLGLGESPVGAPPAAVPAPSVATPASPKTAAALAGLSDAEVEAMLLEKLNGLTK